MYLLNYWKIMMWKKMVFRGFKIGGQVMKAITIINKIKKENGCSIHTAELLTNALHRENKLPTNQAVRFKPLYGKFDIVNADLFTIGEFKNDLCCFDDMSIDDLMEKFIKL